MLENIRTYILYIEYMHTYILYIEYIYFMLNIYAQIRIYRERGTQALCY